MRVRRRVVAGVARLEAASTRACPFPAKPASVSATSPDRVMFAGDWPVCTLGATFAEWVAALQTIMAARPEAERRKLFHDNAERVYGLE
jgi:predicted TIM-barrel fold metal-dependent hydrolase